MQFDTDRVIGLYAPQHYGKTSIMHYIIEQYTQHIPCYLFDTDHERLRDYGDLHKNMFFIYQKDLTKSKEEFLNESIDWLVAKKMNMLIVIEDYDKYLMSRGRSESNSNVYEIASDSRHHNIAIMYSTKTPSYIPTTLRLNTNLFFYGVFKEPLYSKYITQFVNMKDYKKVDKLKHEFLAVDNYDDTTKIVRYNMDTDILEYPYE